MDAIDRFERVPNMTQRAVAALRPNLWPLGLLLVLVVACSAGTGGGSPDAGRDAADGRDAAPGDAVDAAPESGGVPDGAADTAPDGRADAATVPDYGYGVPLAPDSPWPKFRRTADQAGRSPLKPDGTGGQFWSFPTGKGIFSSPVVAGDGTIYIGSADRTFYALTPEGQVRWQEETGEIVDSAALLDDRGRVYWGSGDGILRARDAATGVPVWDFVADPPSENDAFIHWFEGNVAIGPDGTLYVPNDNWFVYAVDRDTGRPVWRFATPDQTWSLPAVDVVSGNLFFGNNNLLPLLGDNVFALDPNGQPIWSQAFIGTFAASPVLTADGLLVLGGFDGYLHALQAADGAPRFEAPARDHIYASPALLSDGTLVQPAADGTVYAFDPQTGAPKWAFDTLEPLRSSPAVDGHDRIYLGSGEGRLFVLEPNGTLRWAVRLIADARNDLNASPALGLEAIYLAGENGAVFSVPYDWCLRAENAANPDCFTAGEDLPADGVFLLFTSAMGLPMVEPPAAVRANDPLRFSLLVREAGDTRLALLDAASLTVTLTPDVPVEVTVSGDRRFFTVVPETRFGVGPDGTFTVVVGGQWLVDPERTGLKMSGGEPGGTLDAHFQFQVAQGPAETLPYPIPAGPGARVRQMHLSRMAAPLPTLLPSYNQIGFDSLHFVAGLIEGDGARGLAWMMGARPEGAGAVPDPTTRTLLPLEVAFADGLLTLSNRNSFALEAMNATLSFDRFRISAALTDTGDAVAPAEVVVSSRCADISMYGLFLRQLGLCNPQTDMLLVAGAILLQANAPAETACPTTTAAVAFAQVSGGLEARVTGGPLDPATHRYALLAVAADDGSPVALDYGLDTEVESDAQGFVHRVFVKARPAQLPPRVRLYLLQDTCPLATADLAVAPR